MKETKLFCVKTDLGHRHFFPHHKGVKMCGYKNEDIIEVIVRETAENEEPMQFAWWNNKAFHLVYPTKNLVDMCFPYGMECEIKAGHGNIYGVIIEENSKK